MDEPSRNPSVAMADFTVHDFYRLQVREISTYAMFMIDPAGIITTWNAGVEKLIGYSEQEWLGLHASIIFTPAEKAEEVCQTEMRMARENGNVSDIRWHRHKNGSEFFANGCMNAIFDEQGTLVGFTKILSDETARKRLQDALTESNSALEQFAYVASHDLQEPLRTVSAYSQLLSDKYASVLDAEGNQFVQYLLTASARMSMLVKDLLNYARLTTEHDRPSSVALDEDLEAALSHLSAAITESGATVTHDPLPSLSVDRGQMVRLFQNLIGNAVKYRKSDQPPKVHITAEQNGAEWIFSVRDNGIGFDPQYSSTIFEPFKRLHSAEEYPGTGVGLAICRRIIQAHRGRIWAESQPGQGTTVSFALPAGKTGKC